MNRADYLDPGLCWTGCKDTGRGGGLSVIGYPQSDPSQILPSEKGDIMSLTGNWSYPTAMKFGAGRIKELPEACAQAGIKKPLLVTDKGLADLPVTQATLDIMEAAGLGRGCSAMWTRTRMRRTLMLGVAAYKAGGHDGVIAFGGGSGLDLGKMVAFMAGQTRPVWDFEDVGDWWTRADADAIAPIVAVPTTAGTGSEVGRASVITNSETHVKKIIFHPKVLPSRGNLRSGTDRGHAEIHHCGHRA